jgi:hypothetical protein
LRAAADRLWSGAVRRSFGAGLEREMCAVEVLCQEHFVQPLRELNTFIFGARSADETLVGGDQDASRRESLRNDR